MRATYITLGFDKQDSLAAQERIHEAVKNAKTVAECESGHDSVYIGYNQFCDMATCLEKMKVRQSRCEMCMKWRFPKEQCPLFVADAYVGWWYCGCIQRDEAGNPVRAAMHSPRARRCPLCKKTKKACA